MTLFLASFPRSGNTLLRQVLHSGWGIASGSVYAADLGNNLALIRACGHVELKSVRRDNTDWLLNPHNLPIKTHRLPTTQPSKAIYVLRDGRAACVSLWHFLGKAASLDDIICGKSVFDKWSDHVLAWANSGKVKAWLRYEDMLNQPDEMVQILSSVFGPTLGDPLQPLHQRDHMAALDGKWVRNLSNWRDHWSSHHERLFMQHNQAAHDQFYSETSDRR